MIRKFKNFDAQEFISRKKALKEAAEFTDRIDGVDITDDDEEPVKIITPEDVFDGKAVYDDPIILKIANIIWKRLKNIGEFGIYHDIVYLNGVPGVWFYGIDNEKSIVCCRNTNVKTISVFNNFEINGKNTAVVTYSTQKLGFKDMIDQLIYDLENKEPLEEAFAGRIGAGYTEKNVKNFEKLSEDDKQYAYDFIRNYGFKDAVDRYYLLIQGKDSKATRILQSFIAPRGLADGDGQSRYIMGCCSDIISLASGEKVPGSVQKAADGGVFDYLIKSYKGGGPAISKSEGDEYDAADDDEALDIIAAREEAKRKELEEDKLKYEKTLRKISIMADAMCHYAKQNGKLDDDDASAMIKRGLFITGKGGIGKSHTVQDALERNHMVSGRDFVNISSGSTTAQSIFNYLYQYNDKLIIFDDSPDLFSEPKKIAVWKSALQSDGTISKVTYPLQNTKDSTSTLYKTGVLTRQERYFKEMGRKSHSERMAYFEKRRKKLKEELGLEYDAETAKKMIEDEWKEIQSEMTPLMPDSYIYNGVVIIIGNDTREEIKKQAGPGHWSAIVDRFQDYDLSPMAESVWAVIKDKIMKEYGDSKIPDALCTIPRALTEEFVDEVDTLIVQPQYKTMTWRVIKAYSRKLRGKYGLEDWKEDLKNDMNTDK